ncbi:MAG: hypothetical protein QOE08_2029 [Thermoleophilaceae bacterium]|nr:hypothetical protein [Thermoleophilaceae bacterium]
MTTFHAAPPVPAHDSADALATVRSHGLRASAARRAVLDALFAARGPVSADAIAGSIARSGGSADLASVYRNLETLDELGLVRHFHAGHGPGLYTVAGDERGYLVCERCGALATAEPRALATLRRGIRLAFGWDAGFGHFPIVGLCPRCTPSTGVEES